MKVDKIIINSIKDCIKFESITIKPNLLFLFGYGELIKDEAFLSSLDKYFPNVIRFGCSSSGEISALRVYDGAVSISAVEFEDTDIRFESISFDKGVDSLEFGAMLMNNFSTDNLRHLMVLSDGIHVNGADLINGIQKYLPKEVAVTGGLAGDGTRFKETVVFNKSGKPVSNCISILGFYGDKISVAYGSKGGWDSFGLERLVTKSKGNELFELDNQPALELYKQFLGERAKDLPASGLLFPLSLREKEDQEPVVRTILGINEDEQSLIFAGSIPQGSYVKLMKANIDRLIDGAEISASTCNKMLENEKAELAVLISCVGRKLVLKQLIEEEIEAVADVLGSQANITGFYSYGELAPFKKNTACLLHNQTMTITTFTEK